MNICSIDVLLWDELKSKLKKQKNDDKSTAAFKKIQIVHPFKKIHFIAFKDTFYSSSAFKKIHFIALQLEFGHLGS